MNNNPLSYNPQAPLPGRYVATIMMTYRDDTSRYTPILILYLWLKVNNVKKSGKF